MVWVWCLFISLFVEGVLSEKLKTHSFEPPFSDIDYSGEKMVSNLWRTGGSTRVTNNFVRLTPDQQSKRGALWSRRMLGVPSFSGVLKFRISGKGKNFIG